MTRELLTIRLDGGTPHQLLIAATAIVAKENGLEIADTKAFWRSEKSYIPDLILIRRQKAVGGFKSRAYQHAVEIVDTSDRAPENPPGFDSLTKIPVPPGMLKMTLEEILAYVRKHLEGL